MNSKRYKHLNAASIAVNKANWIVKVDAPVASGNTAISLLDDINVKLDSLEVLINAQHSDIKIPACTKKELRQIVTFDELEKAVKWKPNL